MSRRSTIVPVAILFEAGLGVAGVGLAYAAGAPLAERLGLGVDVLWRSLAGVAPLLAMLGYLLRSRWRPLADLRRQVIRLVGDAFRGAAYLELAAIAIAAGVGEELLFRGAIQPIAIRFLGEIAGVLVTAVLFGAAHALTTVYFVLATLVGLYFGWMTERYDDLVAPMAVHALYDFTALIVLQRTAARAERVRSSEEPDGPA